MARGRGIPVIVDGAHSFAHWPFVRDDLDCDYYATSVHKWLVSPSVYTSLEELDRFVDARETVLSQGLPS